MEATADMQAQTAPPPRLRERYEQEVLPALTRKFGYSTPMQAPRLEKITLNMGLGEAKQNNKMLEAAQGQLATIAGQQPNVRRARKSIASFKVREGMPVGVSVTLRRARMWEFLDRLCSIAVPRIRDFRGLNPRSFDGRGNYSIGVREQLIFPEIDYDSIDEVRGLDVTITTSARSDEEAFELLLGLGMPFVKEGRPGRPGAEAEEAAEEEKRKEEARLRAEAEQAALEQLKQENPEAYERPEEPAPPAGGDAGGTAPEDASATAGGGGSPAATGPAGEDASQDTDKEDS
jgi:large subunit ribosomal protein L5